MTHSRIYTIINHILHPIQGEIWCLHRVVNERSLFPSNRELEITPEYLESLIKDYLRHGYQFVGIDEIVADIHRNPIDLRKRKRVNISFDDGFRDIYDNAYPILKKYNIPFTIYLTSDFPEGTADIWWIQLEKFFENKSSTNNPFAERFENMMKEIYQNPDNMCETMHNMTGSTADLELCKALALSWKQLGEMVESGLCTIGGHSKTHAGLTRITKEEVRKELTESKRVIESHLPVTARHFSSPYSMEDESIRALIKDAGYETAVIGYGGSVRKGDDLYRMKRRYIIQP